MKVQETNLKLLCLVNTLTSKKMLPSASSKKLPSWNNYAKGHPSRRPQLELRIIPRSEELQAQENAMRNTLCHDCVRIVRP
jgi:hypothetical protein